MTDVRKLARIETITGIAPATNADRLEIAHIGGWQVVVGKGQHSPGDTVVYCEIDSQIPVDDARFSCPEWMIDQSKEVDGVRRYTIKTARLRGNLSQGIAFPVSDFPELEGMEVGSDVTDVIGITKKPDAIPTGSIQIGSFPDKFAMKSDSERIQNLSTMLQDNHFRYGSSWIVTEKIDGMSITAINDNGTIRLASRNWEVDPEGHPFFTAIDANEFLAEVPHGYAVQGELYGEKINGNRLKQKGIHFAVFAVYNNGVPVAEQEWNDWITDHSVPFLGTYGIGGAEFPDTVEELVARYDGIKSKINPDALAEGVVFRHADEETFIELGNRSTFKVISNEYLLKEK